MAVEKTADLDGDLGQRDGLVVEALHRPEKGPVNFGRVGEALLDVADELLGVFELRPGSSHASEKGRNVTGENSCQPTRIQKNRCFSLPFSPLICC